MTPKAHKALIERARGYLAANAAESGADVLIDELVQALAGFQHVGWSEPGELPSEVHDTLSEFVLDYHSGAGEAVLEVLPVWVHAPLWTNTYAVGDGHGDAWEEVDLHETREQAEKADTAYLAEVAHQEPVCDFYRRPVCSHRQTSDHLHGRCCADCRDRRKYSHPPE